MIGTAELPAFPGCGRTSTTPNRPSPGIQWQSALRIIAARYGQWRRLPQMRFESSKAKLAHGHIQNHRPADLRRGQYEGIVPQAAVCRSPGRHVGGRIGPGHEMKARPASAAIQP